MRVNLAALVITLSTLGVSAALADTYCDVPMVDWRPMIELREFLESEGWVIEKIKIDDGCYEVESIDPEGLYVEVLFDPQTFEIMKWELED